MRTLRPLSVLGRAVEIGTDDPALAALLDELLLGLRGHGAAPVVHIDLRRSGDGEVEVVAPNGLRAVPASQALSLLFTIVNQAAVEAGRGLCLHAAAVQVDGRAAVLPGASGAGKSTLAARLVGRGLGYLTDEVVSLDLGSGVVDPYAKPITLKSGSMRLLPHLAPAVDPSVDRFVSDSWFLAAQSLHPRALDGAAEPASLAAIVVPERTGVATSLEPLARSAALHALVGNAFNFLDHGRAWLAPIAARVRAVPCFRLRVGDEPDLDDRVARLVRRALGA